MIEFDGVNQSVNLGTGVNWEDGISAVALDCFCDIDVIGDDRFFNKSVSTTDSGQTMKLGYTPDAGGKTSHIIEGDNALGAPKPNIGVLTYLACTYDGTTVRSFLGEPGGGLVLTEVGTKGKTDSIQQDARNTRIGSSGHDTAIRNSDGKIESICVFDEFLPVNVLESRMLMEGHDGLTPRHRWMCDEAADGVVVGASVVRDSGFAPVGNGSGVNSPVYRESRLATRRRYL